MRTFAMTLTMLGCLAVSGLRADEAKNAGDFVSPLLDRVAKMSSAEQQAWLERLERRADRAARITLPSEEAAKHRAKTTLLLHRDLVTWSMLRDAIGDTNTREKEAIDLLARRYRRQVTETFGKQPDLHDRRQDAWTMLHRDWTKAGSPFDGQDRLIAWLDAAIRAARPDHVAAIPETPKFAEQAPAPAKPQVAEIPRKTPKRHVAAKPIVKPTEARPTETVEVNLDELTARIAGSNLGFRTLESELDEKGAWNAERLEPLAERLKVLVVRRSDLALFRELAPADKRASLGRLTTPKSVISQFGARISEARKVVSGDEFQGADAERRDELNRLESLSRQLADLSKHE